MNAKKAPSLWWLINTIPCKVCGSRLWVEADREISDGIVWSYNCRCTECNAIVNRSYAGRYQYPFTRTEAIHSWWNGIKLRYHRWRFKRHVTHIVRKNRDAR